MNIFIHASGGIVDGAFSIRSMVWIIPVFLVLLGLIFASAHLSWKTGDKVDSRLLEWFGVIGKIVFFAVNIVFWIITVHGLMNAVHPDNTLNIVWSIILSAFFSVLIFGLPVFAMQTIFGAVIIAKRKNFDTDIKAVTAAHLISAAAMLVMWLIFRFVLI